MFYISASEFDSPINSDLHGSTVGGQEKGEQAGKNDCSIFPLTSLPSLSIFVDNRSKAGPTMPLMSAFFRYHYKW